MKKSLLSIIALILFGASYGQSWEKVNFPFDSALNCAVYNGDTAKVK